MRYLTLEEVLELHHLVLEQAGGAEGLRDLGSLKSAVAQPYMAFGGQDLYPTLEEKASALAFSLVMNHPFLDGNKRVGHAAMETLLILNGFEIIASVEEQEQVFLNLAGGKLEREELTAWVQSHVVPLPPPHGKPPS